MPWVLQFKLMWFSRIETFYECRGNDRLLLNSEEQLLWCRINTRQLLLEYGDQEQLLWDSFKTRQLLWGYRHCVLIKNGRMKNTHVFSNPFPDLLELFFLSPLDFEAQTFQFLLRYLHPQDSLAQDAGLDCVWHFNISFIFCLKGYPLAGLRRAVSKALASQVWGCAFSPLEPTPKVPKGNVAQACDLKDGEITGWGRTVWGSLRIT